MKHWISQQRPRNRAKESARIRQAERLSTERYNAAIRIKHAANPHHGFSTVTETKNNEPPILFDLFCGPNESIAAETRQRKLGRAISADILRGIDMKAKTGQKLYTAMREKPPLVTFAAPPCTIWKGFSHINETQERLEHLRQHEASTVVGPMAAYLKRMINEGKFFILEQPENSRMFQVKSIERLSQMPGVYMHTFDQCHWRPERKRTTFITNFPRDLIERRFTSCQHSGPHESQVSGKHAASTSAYPKEMVTTIVDAIEELKSRITTGARSLRLESNTMRTVSRSIIDQGCTHSIVNIDNQWLPLRFTSTQSWSAWGGEEEQHPVGSAALRVLTDKGYPAIVIMHQVGMSKSRPTLIDPMQVRNSGNKINFDVSLENGLPFIESGPHRINLNMENEVTLAGRLPTPHELENLPIIELSLDSEWNHKTYMENLHQCLESGTRPTSNAYHLSAQTIEECVPKDIFPWMSENMRSLTAKNTTRLAKMDRGDDFNTHSARLHPLQHRRIPERVYMDTFFSTVKSFDGYTQAQLFSSQNSKYLYIRPMRSKSLVTTAVQDFARDVGIMDSLFSDNAKENKAEGLTAWCRTNVVTQFYTEVKHSHQNAAERWIGRVKRMSYRLMESTGAPPDTWLAACTFCVKAHNKSSLNSLNGRTPTEAIGQGRPDISEFAFPFYSDVIYKQHSTSFPESRLKKAKYLYPDRAGGVFCHRILLQDGTTISTSDIRLDTGQITITDKNNRDALIKPKGEVNTSPVPESLLFYKGEARPGIQRGVVQTLEENTNGDTTKIPTIEDNDDEENIIGEGEAYEMAETGDRIWHEVDGIMRSTRATGNHEQVDGKIRNEVVIPNKSPFMISPQLNIDDMETKYYLTGISGYRNTKKGLQLRAMWEDGTATWEPFSLMAEDDPKSVADFICEKVAKARMQTDEMKNALQWATGQLAIATANATTVQQAAKEQAQKMGMGTIAYGIYQPRGVKDALRVDAMLDKDPELDRLHGGQRWVSGALRKEIEKFYLFNAIRVLKNGEKPAPNSQRMRCHAVFTAKPDGTFKGRFVAGGHTIDTTGVERSMSVMPTPNTRVLFLIAKANDMSTLCADLSNGYLQSETDEVCHFVAGPEFGEDAGKTCVCVKAIYGLVGSAHAFHRHVHAKMTELRFRQSEGDPNIWMRLNRDRSMYDLVGFYVDDLVLASRYPAEVSAELRSVFEIKVIEKPSRYLGTDIVSKGTMFHFSSKTYIEEALSNFRNDGVIGATDQANLAKAKSPYAHDYQPEADDSELLAPADVTKYQRMVGSLNWIVCGLGRFDVAYATNQLAQFASKPREGHLKALKRIFGYLQKFPDKSFAIDASPPEGLAAIDDELRNRMKSEYTDAVEERSISMPEPLFAEMPITCYVDASHGGDQVSRRSVTGILLLVGKTPVYAKSSRQKAVTSSTFSSEFMALRTGCEYILGLRFLLRSLGVAVTEPTRVLGDNRGVVDNATVFTSCLKKKHNAISYVRVRECVAAGVIDLKHVSTDENLADVLTKGLPADKLNKLRDSIMH